LPDFLGALAPFDDVDFARGLRLFRDVSVSDLRFVAMKIPQLANWPT
jgi:hypothetical protein